ncbi:MAG: AzlD domain-containing protein [Pseudomonadota bacterium]|nr:AzlD domain-containing protein [Pseudomonadota bacterium]
MTETTLYLLSAIAVMTAATFTTRLLPFVLLYRVSDHPLLTWLGRFLPPMMMVLLIVYAFKDSAGEARAVLLQLSCLLLVALLQLLFRQALVSIAGGTALYMFLLQSAGG